ASGGSGEGGNDFRRVVRREERAVQLGGWPLISRGLEPGFIAGHPAAHPAEQRARRGSCRSAHPLTWAGPSRSLSAEGTSMNRYVGLDLHKQFIEVCILDATGRV